MTRRTISRSQRTRVYSMTTVRAGPLFTQGVVASGPHRRPRSHRPPRPRSPPEPHRRPEVTPRLARPGTRPPGTGLNDVASARHPAVAAPDDDPVVIPSTSRYSGANIRSLPTLSAPSALGRRTDPPHSTVMEFLL